MRGNSRQHKKLKQRPGSAKRIGTIGNMKHSTYLEPGVKMKSSKKIKLEIKIRVKAKPCWALKSYKGICTMES